jgi:hypothetical protein
MAGYIPKPPFIAGLNSPNPITKGIVHAVTFVENVSGTDLRDYSDFNPSKTFTENGTPAWVGSPYGGAVDFDGSTDYYLGGTSGLYKSSATKLSILFISVIDTTSFNATVKIILDTANANPTAGGFWLAVDDRGGLEGVNGLQWRLGTSQRVKADNVFNTTPTRYVIILTYDGNGNAKIYIDGVDSTTTDTSSGAFSPKNANIAIGASNSGGFKYNMPLENILV